MCDIHVEFHSPTFLTSFSLVWVSPCKDVLFGEVSCLSKQWSRESRFCITFLLQALLKEREHYIKMEKLRSSVCVVL